MWSVFGEFQGLVYNHQRILALAAEHDGRVSVHGNVRQQIVPTSSWVLTRTFVRYLKGCLHYDTCTPYMYVVQVYGVHVS